MRVAFVLGAFALSGLLSSCVPVQPQLEQPKLAQVLLFGDRVCGSFNTTDDRFNFSCTQPTLPIAERSGWVITPLNRVDITPTPPKDAAWFNDTIGLTVTTPSLTSLEITYGNATRPLNLVRRPSRPQGTSVHPPWLPGQAVWIDWQDDGTMKTWTVSLTVSACMESFPLKFVDVSPNGSSRSAPLEVVLLRKPAETDCGFSGVAGPGKSYSNTQPGTGGRAVSSACTPSDFYFCTYCGGTTQKVNASACTERDAKVQLGIIDAGTGQPVYLGVACTITTVTANSPC